ncbi:hypothetical protein AAG906_023314 [Vitis piasezkii]
MLQFLSNCFINALYGLRFMEGQRRVSSLYFLPYLEIFWKLNENNFKKKKVIYIALLGLKKVTRMRKTHSESGRERVVCLEERKKIEEKKGNTPQMRDSNTDLFDPRTAMDSDSSPGSTPTVSSCDFGCAFNDINFSDWIRGLKRRREDIKKENGADIVTCPEEQILNCNQPDVDDVVACENDDKEAVAMIEESASGNEAEVGNNSAWNMDCSTVVRIKTLHISSLILAAKSPFFYKLFSNEMRESEQRRVTLRINASEEAALMELLNFMYSNTLSTITAPGSLDVPMAADKFEVVSRMRLCSRLLRNLPMIPESALLCLELPSSALMAEAVQPLTDAAKQYLASRYKDTTKFQEEAMALPLVGIEAVLSSDDLQVASEDAVYDFVLKWARARYPKLEERHEILGTRLGRFIQLCWRLHFSRPRPLIGSEAWLQRTLPSSTVASWSGPTSIVQSRLFSCVLLVVLSLV